MENAIEFFNNREKATIIWTIIFFIWFFSKKENRKNTFPILRTLCKLLFTGKVGISFYLMFIYIILLALTLQDINLWDYSLIKDTLIWFIGSGFILFINMTKAYSEKGYFTKIIKDNFKFVLIPQFILNYFVFNLIIELILVPFIFLVFALNIISKLKKETQVVYKLTNYIILITVTFLLIFALNNLFKDLKHFANFENLKDFLLPTILSIAFMPFLYLLTLYGAYDTFFTMLNFWLKDHKDWIGFTKWNALLICKLSIKKINSIYQGNAIKFMNAKSKLDILSIMRISSKK